MLFQTLDFLIFFTLILIGTWICRNLRQWTILIVVSSFLFYGWWNYSYIFLLSVPIVTSYFITNKIAEENRVKIRKIYLSAGIVINIGLLLYFKYIGFFAGNLTALFHFAGVSMFKWEIEVLLPIGISFYTFQAISYQVDVYRGECVVEKSLLRVALYISFFPQLVAGPIIRANDFLGKLEGKIKLKPENIKLGTVKILAGLVKKVVVADNISNFVDFVFSGPGFYPSVIIWAATIAFAIQIYCDFSGYTDIAIGIALIFGIEIPANFKWPYFAESIIGFWRRWHISLSSWLRDYLYIPLGGNRKGTYNKCRNIIIIMLLGGLWHGAGWNYMLWGLWHGVLLTLNHLLRLANPFKNTEFRNIPYLSKLIKITKIGITLYLVLLGWVLFRNDDFNKMALSLKSFVFFKIDFSLSGLGLVDKTAIFTTLLMMLAFTLLHLISFKIGGIDRWISRRNPPGYFLGIASGVFVLILFWPMASQPFIYFQF